MVSKSTRYDRQAYPFITADGLRSPLTDAVDDMVLWLYPGTPMPIKVTADVTDTKHLQLTFSNDDYSFVAIAVDDSYVITDSIGAIVGSISWNTTEAAAILANLTANEDLPWDDLYVDSFACSYRPKPTLSSIRVNGVDITTPIVVIDEDSSVTINTHLDTKLVNLYDKSADDSGGTVNSIIINNVVSGSSNTLSVDVDGKHVWLKSEATCDIRVCTDDAITITEISNDKL